MRTIVAVTIASFLVIPVAHSLNTEYNKTEQLQQSEPELSIDEISGGFGVTIVVTNEGNVEAENVTWIIDLEGDYIFTGGYAIPPYPVIRSISPGETITVNSWQDRFIFGFGDTNINVSIDCENGEGIEKSVKGQAFGFYIGITD